MTVVPFEERYFDSLHECFLRAFSGYKVQLQPSKDELRIRLKHKLCIDPELSLLLLKSQQVIGFLLQTENRFADVQTGYNGGIGIHPDHRRMGFAKMLIDQGNQALTKRGAAQSLLEVIANNEAALSLYNALDYEPQRLLQCFRRPVTKLLPETEGLDLHAVDDPEVLFRFDFGEFECSFIDSKNQLQRDSSHESCVAVISEGRIIGYGILQPHLGRISRLAVGKAFRQRKAGTALINYCQKLSVNKHLTVMNVPSDQEETIQFLMACGFQHEVNQVEMSKRLVP